MRSCAKSSCSRPHDLASEGSPVKTQTIGGVTVSRVVEMEGPDFDPAFILPDSSAEVFDAHRDWLAPHFYDYGAGKLILSFHSYVVRTRRHTILVDTCAGNDKNRPTRPFYHQRQGPFLDDLRAAGVAPEAVDYVFCTHLHSDHVGWNTRLENGRWVPTFPNATYVFGRTEFDSFGDLADDGNHAAAYQDSVLPIVEAGRAALVETDFALDDEVWLEPSPGHTPGHYCVRLASHGSQGVLSGDVMHHPVQCARPDWISLACMDAEASRKMRLSFLERYADTDVTVFPAHFAAPTAGRIKGAAGTCTYAVLD